MGLYHDGLGKGHFFTSTCATSDITNKEPDKHSEICWIHKDNLIQTLDFTTLVNSGLYQYCTGKRAPCTRRSLHRNEHSRAPLCDTDKDYIQWINAHTGTLHIDEYSPEHAHTIIETPHLYPMRIAS
jgi:hypothetical protein